MFHVEMFTSSIPTTGANTFQQLTYNFVQSHILPQQVNGLQVSPDLPNLMFVAGLGANLVHVRAQANSMLPYPYPALSPNNRGTSFESPPRFWDYSAAPIPLKPTEEFDIFVTENAAGAQTEYVIAAFTDGSLQPLPVQVNPPGITINPASPGRFFSAHWTASTTLTANNWTLIQPAFDQPLFAGSYGLVGARFFSATSIFFRMYPSMGPKWRPGGLAVNAYDQMDPTGQRYFGASTPLARAWWGIWLQFFQNIPPLVEVYATAADVAEEGWFDLVYLGPSVAPSI